MDALSLARCHVGQSVLTRSRIEINVDPIRILEELYMKQYLVAGFAAAVICGARALAADLLAHPHQGARTGARL
jgi:hypothetical protein